MNSFFILLAIVVNYSVAQHYTCTDFKTGTFSYLDPDYSDLKTVRNDSLQFDSYPSMGWEITSSINWLSECRYETTCIAVNTPKIASLIGTRYTIEIIEINENKIRCKTVSEGIEVEKELIKTDFN